MTDRAVTQGADRRGVTLRPDPTDPAARWVGPDVVRALALLGVVVMNYHGFLILQGAPRRDGGLSDLLDPWTGVLSTRFAATFVLVAGVGVTLMTRSARGDAERTRALRWRLASRGVVLYTFGLGFDLIWAGSILPFYGAMFAVAALLFTLRSRWLVLIGAVVAVAAWGLAWWRLERELAGHDVRWLFDPPAGSVRGVAFDLFVNGTHPLLPWLAFFCAGMVLGRVMTRAGWVLPVLAAALTLVGVAAAARAIAIDLPDLPSIRARVLFSTEPFDRGIVHTTSAVGTSLLAVAVLAPLAERARRTTVVDIAARAGQLVLSIYVAHALVFNLVVDWLGWIEQGDAATAVLFGVAVWTPLVVAAAEYQRAFARGPFEQVYRSITR